MYMYTDLIWHVHVHGKSCAQVASTEETTHCTTHVQPHKITKTTMT